jgi:hypothetical protein
VTGLLVECKFSQARERFSEACFWRKALWRPAMVEQVKKKKPGKRFGVKISEVAQGLTPLKPQERLRSGDWLKAL